MREIYRKRIESLVKEYSIFKRNSMDVKQELNNLEEIANIHTDEIKKITDDVSIKPSQKYELINLKLEDIEKVALKISNIYKHTTESFNNLNKDRDILIKTCVEDNPELTEDDILKELVKLMEKEGL